MIIPDKADPAVVRAMEFVPNLQSPESWSLVKVKVGAEAEPSPK